jgi:hypothetical protein
MKRRGVYWRIVTVVLIGSSVMAFWLLTDRHARRTYQVHVALDRYEEWKGPDVVVLYRTGRDGVVCFDAFRWKDLHDHLSAKNGQVVTVEYETFSDFGKVRGYNLRSVDGMILANDNKPFTASSGVISDGPGSAGESDCW